MLFSYGCGQQCIAGNKKCRWIAGDFDHHVDVAVRSRAHCPIEHIPGYTESHWMPPLGKRLRHITLAAAMVNEFVENSQSANRTLLLASNYGTNWSQVVYENFILRYGHSTQLIDVTSCVKIWDTIIGAEKLAHISNYQTLSADKNTKRYQTCTKLVQKVAPMCAIRG